MGVKEVGAGVLVLVGVVLGWKAFWPASDPVAKAALSLDTGSDVPAIGLVRLGRTDGTVTPPERDLFKFGRDSRVDLAPVPTPVIRLMPIPTPDPFPAPQMSPTPTPWPLLDLALIGIVDNGQGRRIGSFVKDGEIVLVGVPGQVLGNAFRITSIGVETAEIEELGSGRTRRLPLRTR
ncbi:MAG: hypothetical protein JJE39_05725 [Vicinamibacteria bacterium]|nr:hypothetical protein [Vicinamibacteria bacterium]